MINMRSMGRLILVIIILGALGYFYWKFFIPTHRVQVHSELIMLGDLDGDHKWTKGDLKILDDFLKDPFSKKDAIALRIDMNQNGLIDEEDLRILRVIVDANGDPYAAEYKAFSKGETFPRPRECYKYLSDIQYNARPLWALPYPPAIDSDIDWLVNLHPPKCVNTYGDALDAAIYAEAIRLDRALQKRKPNLLPVELDYAKRKLALAKTLFREKKRYELLLALIDLVEDAETLTERNQSEFSLKMLLFRDHLREILGSKLYDDFKQGKKDWRVVLKIVSDYLKSDLELNYDFETLGPPRNLSHLENYLQRAEWQYYKNSTSEEDFLRLIRYAQHDPRYLHAVSRTSRKLSDLNVENHNLPMLLLFREALRIKNNDKKKAVGMLDEAIRIPYAWIKSIPREALPSSLAFDNFLLPGNKEDGADKSRHWNVFGGICLYKSPQEAIDLALKREMQDFRDTNYTEEGMREFFRDLIADLNGMYQVMTVNPELLTGENK
jgi:hypothetical protein